MTFTTKSRSPHQIIADENPDAMRRSAWADALTEQARRRREQAEYDDMIAADARNPLGPMPIDPSAGDVRRTFYETIRARGE